MVSKAVTVGEKALAKATEKVEREKASRAIAGHAESAIIRPIPAPRAKAQKEKDKAEKTAQKEKAKVERAGFTMAVTTVGTMAVTKARAVERAMVGTTAAREFTNSRIQTESGHHWTY